jgi:hypothetical protein
MHQHGPGPGRDPRLQCRRLRFALPEVQGRPAEHGLPFSTWSLVRLTDFLVAEGVVVDDIWRYLRSPYTRACFKARFE